MDNGREVPVARLLDGIVPDQVVRRHAGDFRVETRVVVQGEQVAAGELEALEVALRDLQPGDVVAMMCIESGAESRARVEELGGETKVAG